MLFNNYCSKARRWSQLFLLLVGISLMVGVFVLGWRIWRCKEYLNNYNYLQQKCLKLTHQISLKQSLKHDYAQLHHRAQHLSSWRAPCFVIELLDYIASCLHESVRLDCLTQESSDTIHLTGQAHKPEYVFALIELLESQSWLAQAKLKSINKNTTDDSVVFVVYLKKH